MSIVIVSTELLLLQYYGDEYCRRPITADVRYQLISAQITWLAYVALAHGFPEGI